MLSALINKKLKNFLVPLMSPLPITYDATVFTVSIELERV